MDGAIKGFLDDAMDDFVVRPHDEIRRVLGLDDGAVVVVKESESDSVVDDVVVWGGAGVWWIHVGVGIGHGVFATIHEDSGVAHVGGRRDVDGHRFRDALFLEMADGVDIRSSDVGGKSTEVRGDVGILEFLDGSHGQEVVVAEGVRRDGDDRTKVGGVLARPGGWECFQRIN